MQLIESFKSAIATKALSVLGYGKLQQTQSQMQIHSMNQIYPAWYSYKVIAAYKKFDTIFSVVNKLAGKAASVPIYGYGTDGEDLPETDKLTIFLLSLTYMKRVEMFFWLFLKMECFIYKEKTLGVNGKISSIHFLNPNYVTLVLTDEFPEKIHGYLFNDPARGIMNKFFTDDEVIFIRGFNPSDNWQDSWRAFGPVEALLKRLTRVESNMNNSVGQMQNGGVPGVMYFKDLPHNAQSKTVVDGHKENFARFVKNPDNKGTAYITAGEAGYFSIGSNLVDIASIDMEKLDDKKIYNTFGVSDVLFNSDAASTESNVREMRQTMWTDAIIPKFSMVEDAFNTELVTDFGVGYRTVKFDIGGIKDLQRNQLELMQAMAAAPVMIPNDILEAMGYDRVDNLAMDMPLIKSGYEPIDNFEPLPPIE